MKPTKAEKLGKKQQRHIDATEAHRESSWSDLVDGTRLN